MRLEIEAGKLAKQLKSLYVICPRGFFFGIKRTEIEPLLVVHDAGTPTARFSLGNTFELPAGIGPLSSVCPIHGPTCNSQILPAAIEAVPVSMVNFLPDRIIHDEAVEVNRSCPSVLPLPSIRIGCPRTFHCMPRVGQDAFSIDGVNNRECSITKRDKNGAGILGMHFRAPILDCRPPAVSSGAGILITQLYPSLSLAGSL